MPKYLVNGFQSILAYYLVALSGINVILKIDLHFSLRKPLYVLLGLMVLKGKEERS